MPPFSTLTSLGDLLPQAPPGASAMLSSSAPLLFLRQEAGLVATHPTPACTHTRAPPPGVQTCVHFPSRPTSAAPSAPACAPRTHVAQHPTLAHRHMHAPPAAHLCRAFCASSCTADMFVRLASTAACRAASSCSSCSFCQAWGKGGRGREGTCVCACVCACVHVCMAVRVHALVQQEQQGRARSSSRSRHTAAAAAVAQQQQQQQEQARSSSMSRHIAAAAAARAGAQQQQQQQEQACSSSSKSRREAAAGAGAGAQRHSEGGRAQHTTRTLKALPSRSSSSYRCSCAASSSCFLRYRASSRRMAAALSFTCGGEGEGLS